MSASRQTIPTTAADNCTLYARARTMNYWPNASDWLPYAVLIVAWLLFRPLRDHYVLEICYFKRVYLSTLPDRGEKDGPSVYKCFDDYLAAKATFDQNELTLIPSTDNEWIETEQSIFMVSARTKALAISGLKWKHWFFGSLFGSYGVVLHRTDIHKRRKAYRRP